MDGGLATVSPDDRLFDAGEAVTYLLERYGKAFTKNWLYRQAKAGAIRSLRPSARRVLFLKSHLDGWISQLARAAAPEGSKR